MRIDTTKGGWSVWHAEWMEELSDCLWVDTGEGRWAHRAHPLYVIFGGSTACEHVAKRLEVNHTKRFIIIDGIPDADQDSVADEHSLRVPTRPEVTV